jgi:hypothetical protein
MKQYETISLIKSPDLCSHLMNLKFYRGIKGMSNIEKTSTGLFYKNVGRLLSVSDSEELVGVTHRR